MRWRAPKHYHISHQGSSVLSSQPKAKTPSIYSPHENRAVVPLYWARLEVTGRSGQIDRTHPASVRSMDARHVSPPFNLNLLISIVK